MARLQIARTTHLRSDRRWIALPLAAAVTIALAFLIATRPLPEPVDIGRSSSTRTMVESGVTVASEAAAELGEPVVDTRWVAAIGSTLVVLAAGAGAVVALGQRRGSDR